MGSSTYEIEAPKQCRFCGEKIPRKRTAYDNEYVSFTAALDHFIEHPGCATQLVGEKSVDAATMRGEHA